MKYLTTKQAGHRLGITDARIRKLILTGRLPAQKIGRDWMIKEEDLQKLVIYKRGRPRKATP